MINGTFRPWGDLEWLKSKLDVEEWSLLGCASTEDRCCSVLHHLDGSLYKYATLFLRIDSEKEKYRQERDRSIAINIEQINKLTSGTASHETFKLMGPIPKLARSIQSFAERSNGNVILDITSFPKRFFFFITKLLLENENVENLLVTYMN